MTGEARLWRSWNTMRSRYATATPALIPEYERGGAGAQPGRLLKFHAPEIVFGIDSMAEAAHAAVRLGALRPLLVPGPTLDLDTPADRPAACSTSRRLTSRRDSTAGASPRGCSAAPGYRAAPPASRVAVAIAARRACGPPLTPESLRPLTAQRHGQAQQPLPAPHTPFNRAMLH
jgi:hypothetical protein